MKISKLALIALLGGALMAFGCSSDDNGGGSGGTAGTGGTAGGGGEAGGGGTAGGGGSAPACITPPDSTCMNGDIDATVACCELPTPPSVPNACTGEESLENRGAIGRADGLNQPVGIVFASQGRRRHG